MVVNDDGRPEPAMADERFELERFTWLTPDRVAVSGRFIGLHHPPSAPPALVVRGDGREQHVPAAPGSARGSLADGEIWRVDFEWRDPPIPFDTAVLAFGDELRVELPEPGTRRGWFRWHSTEVERPATPPPAEDGDVPDEPVGLQAELLATRQEVRRLETRLARAEEELSRTRADLEKEREGREEDGAAFREGLDAVRAAAHEALQHKAAEVARLEQELAQRDQLRESVGEAAADAHRLLERLTALAGRPVHDG